MKQKLMAFLVMFLLFVPLLSQSALAVSACPDEMQFTVDGQKVRGYLRGDEFFNYAVDMEGNVMLPAPEGGMSYVSLGAEQMSTRSSGDAGRINESQLSDPAVLSGVKALAGYSEPLNIAESKYMDSSGIKILKEKLPLVIIKVKFANNPELTDYTDEAWSTSIFGSGTESIAGYYSAVSNGKQTYVPAKETCNVPDDGIITVTLNGSHPNFGSDFNNGSITLFQNAVNKAFESGYIDFSSFDTDGDGVLSTDELAIGIVVNGYESSYDVEKAPAVWAHAMGGGYIHTIDGVEIRNYIMEGATQERSDNPADSHMATIGTMTHELGHHRGLPDLYNTTEGPVNNEVGLLSLMASGSWGSRAGGFGGCAPVALDAWSRVMLGYQTPTAFSIGSAVNLIESADTASYNILKIQTNKASEYFLLENRQIKGIDNGLSSYYKNGGVVIWHIDTSMINTYPREINGTGHYPGVMQEFLSYTDTKNNDPFFTSLKNGGAFSSITTPSSNCNDGSASGISFTINSPAGNSMAVSGKEVNCDVNNDGKVDEADAQLLQEHYFSDAAFKTEYDLNLDSKNDTEDVLVVRMVMP